MFVIPPNGTLLLINPLSGADTPILTPSSARGITQTFRQIAAGSSSSQWLRRDVNAVKRNLSDTRFHLLSTTITCRDGESPCLDNTWIGVECEVWCAFELSYPSGGTPARPEVSGSARTVVWPNGGPTITYYRPVLQCMLTDIRNGFAEYQGLYDWQMDFEELGEEP